jgi:hypothetical protein
MSFQTKEPTSVSLTRASAGTHERVVVLRGSTGSGGMKEGIEREAQGIKREAQIRFSYIGGI